MYTCKQKCILLCTKMYTCVQMRVLVDIYVCVQIMYTTIQKCIQVHSLLAPVFDRKVGLTADEKLYTLRVRVEIF